MSVADLRLVSAEEARGIAEAHVRGSTQSGLSGLSPSTVEDAADVRLNVYGLRVPLKRLWAVFFTSPVPVLRSSTVVLVEKIGGRVVYCGSARDEG